MHKNIFLMCASCAALMLLPNQASFGASNKGSSGDAFDAAFVKKAANINMTEVELGKMAQDKGQSGDVKSFGQRMVTDHTKLNEDLESAATALKMKMPDKINAKHQALIDKLSKLSGAEFDKTYAEEMTHGHEQAVRQFENAQAKVTQPDLKKYIDSALPSLKEHLELAKKLKGQ